MNKLMMVTICGCVAMSLIVGCFTRAVAYTKTTDKDGVVTESKVSILGTGDKASEVAAEGLFADGTADDLGAGVKNAKASQQSTGIDGTLAGMGQLMTGMASLMAASQGGAPAAVARKAATSEAPDEPDAVAAPSADTATASAALAAKMQEAKASGKPLVVVAGNSGCGYCAKLDAALDAAPAFLARTDIVLYRETSPWATNAAGKWTGGGKFPVLRVTQWDAAGAIVCDHKVNRPQTVADIEAALKTCGTE